MDKNTIRTQKNIIFWFSGIMVLVIIVILSVESLRNSVFAIWDIFSSVFFQGWFFAGILIGLLSLGKATYDVIFENIGYSQFTLYKNILLGFGGFFAIGGLITESLDDTIKLEQSYYQSHQAHHIDMMNAEVKRMQSYVGVNDCSAESIYTTNIKDYKDKEKLTQANSDKIILCIYSKMFSDLSSRVITMWKSPELLKSLELVSDNNKYVGVDALYIDLEGKANLITKMSTYLNNEYNEMPVIDPNSIKEKSALIVTEFDSLQTSKKGLKRISSIKKIIFVGVGMDIVAILASILLILIISGKVNTHPHTTEEQ